MGELEHYGVKGMKWRQTKAQPEVSLQGQSLLDTKVYQTPQWLRDNGYSLSVTDALNALKSVLAKLPKRRSKGSDLVDAMKRVNSQGGVSIRKMSSNRIAKGEKVMSRYTKKSK